MPMHANGWARARRSGSPGAAGDSTYGLPAFTRSLLGTLTHLRGRRWARYLALALLLLWAPMVVRAEEPQIVSATGEDLVSLSNEFISIKVNTSSDGTGRFGVDTTGGDPTKLTDDNQLLIYGNPIPCTSYTTIRIDNNNYVFGGSTETRAGKGASYGQVLIAPQVAGDELVCSWQYPGGIVVTQKLSFTQSPSTGYDDTARIEYVVLNTDSVSHQVGIRLAIDTMLGKNDGAPFRVGDKALQTNAVYLRSDLPEYWQAFDSLTNTTLTAQGTLLGGELTPPDMMYFTNWGDVADNPWTFAMEPDRDYTRSGEFELDSAAALFWNPVALPPGRSASYVAYYGLGGITIVPGVLSLGVTSPSQVTTAKDRLPDFAVTAYIQNTGEGKARDVKAEISLPTALKLSPGQAAVRALPDIEPGETVQVVWKVQPATTTPTTANYTVSVSARNADTNSVTRSVKILAPPKLKISTSAPALTVKDYTGTSEFELNEDERLFPSPFAIEATVTNEGGAVAYGVEAVASIGSDLALAKGELQDPPAGNDSDRSRRGESAAAVTSTKRLGYLKPGESVSVKWWLEATEGGKTATVSLMSTSTSTDPQSALVKVSIPKLDPKVIIDVSELEGRSVGSYVSVPVYVTNIPDMSEIHFDVNFPNDKLRCVSVSRGTLFVDAAMQQNSSDTDTSGEPVFLPWGQPTIDNRSGLILKISGNLLKSGWTSGEVARLNFRVVSDGTASLGIEELTLLDGHRRTIKATVVTSDFTLAK